MNTCPPCNHDCNEGRDCPARKGYEMTDIRTKAMKMALEFIVLASSKDRAWFTEKEFEVVAALRQALAQPEEKMRIEGNGKLTTKPYPDGYESEQQFRQALAQLEQEPVMKFKVNVIDDEHPNGIPLEQWGNTSPPHYWGNVTNAELVEELRRRGMMESLYPEQEPVAWLNITDEGERYIQFAGSIKDFNEGAKFYTALPKREWKGLTDDDKHFLLANAWNKEQAFDGFMDAIDKFLKEKNT